MGIIPPARPSLDRPASKGIMLLLAALQLAMLTVLAAALFTLVSAARRRGAAVAAQTEARLAAGGGMEYARARLLREGAPFGFDEEGRFSGWSGRLRGGGALFALAVGSPEGRLPVNGGSLSGSGGSHPYHDGLAHALNNLGALLPVSSAASVSAGSPAAWPVAASWLGRDLIQRRPPGGYREWQDVEAVLRPLGYTSADLDAVRPFCDLGPYEQLAESGRTRFSDSLDFPPYAPVNLLAASGKVLASLWMYLCHAAQPSLFGPSAGYLASWSRPADLPYGAPPGSPSGWLGRVILKEDAERLADRLVAWRQGGRLTWRELYRRLIEEAEGIFVEDARDLTDAANRLSWTQAKAEVAFNAVALDPIPARLGLFLPATATGWGVDRVPVASVRQEGPGVMGIDGGLGVQRAKYPAGPGTPSPSFYFDSDPLICQGGTLAPPVWFEVECRASAGPARARAAARLRAAERADFVSQEDFENLAGGGRWAGRGIFVSDGGLSPWVRRGAGEADPFPPGHPFPTPHPVYGSARVLGTPLRMMLPWPDRPPGSRRWHPRVASLPRYDRRSRAVPPGCFNNPLYGFSRTYGALCLAGLEAGPLDAELYWTFKEDFDGTLASDVYDETDPAAPFAPDPPLGAWGTSSDDDKSHEKNTPFQRNASPLGLQCPGLSAGGDAGDGSVWLQAMSFEFWGGGESLLKVSGNNSAGSTSYPNYLNVRIQRPTSDVDPCARRTVFPIGGAWGAFEGGGLVTLPSSTVAILDADDPAGGACDHHVALVTWCEEVGRPPDPPPHYATWTRLYVDGADRGSWLWPAERLRVTAKEKIEGTRIDEVRLYDRALSPSEVEARYRLGRFVRSGVYTSPLYAFDAPATLLAAGWTGLRPPGFPADCLRVSLATPDATVLLGDGDPVTFDADAARHDLGGVPPTGSFRYEVAFDAGNLPPPILDSPVFESLWIMFRRKGKAPAWSSWTDQ